MHTADLLFPKSTQRVLAALLLHPDREFGTNELVQMVGAGRGRGLALVRAMIEAGLAKTRRLGRNVLVSANREHPVFPELRSLCVKSFGVADQVREALAPWVFRIEVAVVFGSVAQGTERPASDLDLLVVGDVDLLELAPAIAQVEAATGRQVDLLLYGPAEWRALREQSVMQEIRRSSTILVAGHAERL